MTDLLTRPDETVADMKAAKSSRKAKGDGHLRRAEILHAAEMIFVRDGYQGATIRKIAEEVGVSSTALYMHFRDKDAILLEICDNAMEKLRIQNAELAALSIDPVLRLRRMLTGYIKFGIANPNAYQLAFCSGPTQAPYNRFRSTKCEIIYVQVLEALNHIADAGRLRTDDVKRACQVLRSACHGLITMLIVRPNADWGDDDVLIAAMLDTLFQGIATA